MFDTLLHLPLFHSKEFASFFWPILKSLLGNKKLVLMIEMDYVY